MNNLVLVTGSRDWPDGRRVYDRLSNEPIGTVVIQGGAKGADDFAKRSADLLGFKCIEVRADWRAYGKSAGPMRNRKMLDMKPCKVIAFCKDNSRGTMDTVREAMSRGIPVEVINV